MFDLKTERKVCYHTEQKEGIRMRKTTADLLLILVTIIWGGGFIATSSALETFPPFTLMAIRFLGASMFPCIIAWRKWRTLSRNDWLHGMVIGFFLFLAFAFQTFGLQMTTPGKNAFFRRPVTSA